MGICTLLIDSAQATEWYNEKAVGRAIRSSNISSDQLFLVSKLHPRHLGYEVTKQQFNSSLRDLVTSSLDLFLLHYPRCFSAICNDIKLTGSWQASWKALQQLYDELKIRAIGVLGMGTPTVRGAPTLCSKSATSTKRSFKNLLALQELNLQLYSRETSICTSSMPKKPPNSDPFNADKEIQDHCQQEGIQYMGYSTLWSQWLMRGYSSNPVLNHPLIQGIAVAQACTPAQVVLSWALENMQVIVPRSSNQFRIMENLDAPHCNLTKLQVTSINALDGHIPRLHGRDICLRTLM